jgi:hypothetical protein
LPHPKYSALYQAVMPDKDDSPGRLKTAVIHFLLDSLALILVTWELWTRLKGEAKTCRSQSQPRPTVAK